MSAFSVQAFAALGEKFENSSPLLQKKLVQNRAATYSVHESVVNGATIHEYVLPDGTIFGVTWKGYSHPDLSNLLGSYKAEYDQLNAKRVHASGRVPIDLKSSKVSVRMSGHMRDVHGEAYDPKLLPQGFSLEEFK